MASDIDQSQTSHTSLEDMRKQVEEKREKRNRAKCSVKKKDKIEKNYGEEDNESQYDPITEEEIRMIKTNSFSVRMPDLSKILPEDHFINVYAKCASGITDGYYEYQVMDAFWLISAMTKSCVYLEFKSEEITTHLWLILIGRSTTSRKTTSIGIVRKLYEIIFGKSLPDTDYSLEGYLRQLADNCGLLDQVRDEVAGLLAKYKKNYNDGIFDIECKVYDRETIEKALKKAEDSILIENPCVTKLYGTTLIRFIQSIEMETIESGYGYRFLYVYPYYKKERKPLEEKTEEDNNNFNVVLERARIIKTQITDPLMGGGQKQFKIEPEALKYLDQKMANLEEEYENDEVIGSLVGRYQIYAVKLAMLIELGKKEINYTITLDSMKIAIDLIENYFIQTFKSIIECKNNDIKSNNIEKVLSIFKSVNCALPRNVLWRQSKLTERVFDEVIATLIKSDQISAKIEEKTHTIYYIYKTDEDRKFEEESLPKDKQNILDKLRKKGNSAAWTDIKNNSNLDKVRFNKAIGNLVFERKIEVREEHTNTDKPRKIISLIN